MKRSLLIFLLASIVMLAPSVTFAAGVNFFGPIVPTECKCPGSAPDFGCVFQTVQNLLAFAVSIGSIIATLMIAYAGILLITSPINAENRTKAKNMLTNAVIGLVIALSAWLIIDFVMKALYNGAAAGAAFHKAEALPWNGIISTTGGKLCFVPTQTTGSTTGPGPTATGGPGTASGTLMSSGISGVTLSSTGNCTDKNKSTCTSLDGMQPALLQQISNIKNSCSNCTITITGGTETGHSTNGAYTHGNGYKVDLRLDSGLDKLLEGLISTGTRTGDGSGPSWTDSCSKDFPADQQNQYVRETSDPAHWDIRIIRACPL